MKWKSTTLPNLKCVCLTTGRNVCLNVYNWYRSVILQIVSVVQSNEMLPYTDLEDAFG